MCSRPALGGMALMSRAQSLQLLVVDGLLAGLALSTAEALSGQWPQPGAEPGSWAGRGLVLVSWLAALRVHGPYLREAHRSRLLLTLRAAWGLGLATLMAAGLERLSGLPEGASPPQHLLALALMVAGVVITRLVLARGSWWRAAAPHIVPVGAGDDKSRQLLSEMEAARRCRVATRAGAEVADPGGPDLTEPAARLRRGEITHLLLLPDAGCDVTAAIQVAGVSGIEIVALAPLYMDLMERAPLTDAQDSCHEVVIEPLATPVVRWLHRANDLVMCALLAPLALALTALAALAVKLTSPGPVFFCQDRAGRGERPFILYKIRTMTHSEGNDFAPTCDRDPRITPVGGILRRLRIDELPQLLCVLTGDMSLIGPRPEMTARHEELKSPVRLFHWRTKACPGITGWAQVNLGYCGDDEEAFEKLRYDLYYVHRQSPLLDLRIMLRTLPTILLGQGVR